ncbi:MAG: rubrerythrin family protein [bacterium]
MAIGPKTKKNLEEAFAGESMARNKYTYFASLFRKAGFVQIANIFEETANNEKEHAKLWAKQLGLIGDTFECLAAAIAGEKFESEKMYPRMAKEAKEEGHEDLAKMFTEVGEVEEAHRTRYEKLLKNLKTNKVFKKAKKMQWKCDNCGYIHTDKEAPGKCPACSHPQAYFELLVENY